MIFDSAKECVRVSKRADYKPFCFTQLQKSAQRIETERFGELFAHAKAEGMKKSLKIKASTKAAPKKKSSHIGCRFHTHIYLADTLIEIDKPVKEKLRRVMGNSHSRNLPQRTTYTCDTHEPRVRSHEDARGRVDQET